MTEQREEYILSTTPVTPSEFQAVKAEFAQKTLKARYECEIEYYKSEMEMCQQRITELERELEIMQHTAASFLAALTKELVALKAERK
jgi:hypothetical protein